MPMREIDVASLVPLSGSGRGPWLLEGAYVLKTTREGRCMSSVEDARVLFDLYRTARDAGLAVPEAYEVLRVGQGFGVVLEYVGGIGLSGHLSLGLFSPTEAGVEMGRVLRGMHTVHAQVGRDWNGVFGDYVRALGRKLPEGLETGLMRLFDGLGDADSFLHGDPDVSNVVVHDGCLCFVDLESAGFGNPLIELAIAYSRLVLDAPEGDRRAQEMWAGLLSGYYAEDASVCDFDEARKAIAVLAEVEHCCKRYGMAWSDPERMSDAAKARLAVCAARLDGLLG